MKIVRLDSAVFLVAIFCFPFNSAVADGCAPGQPCYEAPKPKKAAPSPVKLKPVAEPEEIPAAVEEPEPEPEPEPLATYEEQESGLIFSLGAGVNVLYFDCEDTRVAPGVYADVRGENAPVNIRLGFEGTNFESEQKRFTAGSPFFNDDPEVNFYRVLGSLEYVAELADDLSLFIGGGPDLIRVNGDVDDTTVGGHLSSRLQKNITESINLAVEGGYLWADIDEKGEDLELDSFFTGVQLVFSLN